MALAGIAYTASASAQQVYLPRDKIVQALAKQHAETPAAFGLTRGGRGVVELFRTADGETWTLVLTTPNGMSRVLVSGGGWMSLPMPLPPMF